MARVRWCGRCFVLGVFWTFWIFTAGVATECWYDDERHEEGSEVETTEPCLNCTCSRGALLCYLRVCPRLPNPPPSGCILLHRFRRCCPELICTELPGNGNTIEARSDPEDEQELSYDVTISNTACIVNGSIYGSGSAMDSSSLCEYCYCLRGKQTCVKPKCLLSIEGCTPIFESTSCCPTQYNCTSKAPSRVKFMTTSSTTTTTTTTKANVEGCIVDGHFYPEGGKVLGVGHSVCDNCYCLRNLLRCEPLSCAPPLLGCTPVIKQGECCAASYNCNGTIEIQLEPNYGHFPIVSKEYAKLRKEVQRNPTTSRQGVVTVPPYYVLAESLHPFTTNKVQQRSPDTFGTTRHFTGVPYNPSSPKPYYHNTMTQEYIAPKHYQEATISQKVHHATTNYEFEKAHFKRVYSTTSKSKIVEHLARTAENAASDSKIPIQNNDNIGNTEKLDAMQVSFLPTTTENIEPTTADITTTGLEQDNILFESQTTTDMDDRMSTENVFTTTEEPTTNSSFPIIWKSILQSSDCVYNDSNSMQLLNSNQIEVTTVLPVDPNEVNNLAENKDFNEVLSTTEYKDSLTEITTEYNTEDKASLKEGSLKGITLRNLPNSPHHLQGVMNISKNKKDNDYEFDYNEPTLPPSLPNLRIIPFLAADAVDSTKEILKNNIYAEDKIGNGPFVYTNLFSPPAETEGGFVPKDPAILDSFYENAVSLPPTPREKYAGQCQSDGKAVSHGSSIPSDSPCTTCTCFYGNIVCQKPNCPLPRPGCKKSPGEITLCCPNYICGRPDTPPLFLEPLDVLSPPPQNLPEISSGPFKDVIKTESPPNLVSLMVNMRPFSQQTTQQSPQTSLTTKKSTNPTTTNKMGNYEITTEDFDVSFDKVLELIFSEKTEHNSEILIKNESTQTKTEINRNQIQTMLSEKTSDAFSWNSRHTEPPLTDDPFSSSLKPTEPPLTESLNQSTYSEKGMKSNFNNSNNSVGPLKLAGCNIYGRMYRVGRIISELSNSCLECKCTEVGVQCRELKC